MEKFGFQEKDPERELIAKLSAEALALAKTYEWPNNIYHALDNNGIKDPAGRKKYIELVSAELGRRGARAAESHRLYGSKNFTDRQMKGMIEESRGLEARHPKEDEE